MTELKLEAGKTYVFKGENCKQFYIDSHPINRERLEQFYDNGFCLEGVVQNIGYIDGLIIIDYNEREFFKLKEDENVSPDKPLTRDTELTFTAPAVDWLKVFVLLGRSNGRGVPNLCDSLYKHFQEFPFENLKLNTINYYSIQEELENKVFPKPKSQADVLREQAQDLLRQADELEGK